MIDALRGVTSTGRFLAASSSLPAKLFVAVAVDSERIRNVFQVGNPLFRQLDTVTGHSGGSGRRRADIGVSADKGHLRVAILKPCSLRLAKTLDREIRIRVFGANALDEAFVSRVELLVRIGLTFVGRAVNLACRLSEKKCRNNKYSEKEGL
jgi:hypothetical protein